MYGAGGSNYLLRWGWVRWMGWVRLVGCAGQMDSCGYDTFRGVSVASDYCEQGGRGCWICLDTGPAVTVSPADAWKILCTLYN